MSSVDSYITECERMIARANIVKRHYPDAELRDVLPDKHRVWSAEGARPNANGVDILIGKNSFGQPAAFFCPYHEIREREGEDNEIRVRVYTDWPQKVEDWDMAERIRRDPDLLGAVLTALRRER